ncbi:hypothetical protein QR685DRAFT_506000 [Neurospora intermedia]|uniref:Uncharacterized protein n=1 Tax=Neurospora intermedia TaxID=5142 RepID=A0ABR3D1Y4_NEUIN
MSSPGAGSFSTLSSYASSASDHQGQQHAIGHPLLATAQPTTTRTTTTLPPVSPSSSANATNFLTNNNSSTPSNNNNSNNNNNNNNNNNTPNFLGPRTAMINFNLLPELETGLDINRLNYLCKQEQQSIITTTSTDKQPEEEEEPEELGWKDAYEVMIKVALQGLAAWARRWRRVRGDREQAMV